MSSNENEFSEKIVEPVFSTWNPVEQTEKKIREERANDRIVEEVRKDNEKIIYVMKETLTNNATDIVERIKKNQEELFNSWQLMVRFEVNKATVASEEKIIKFIKEAQAASEENMKIFIKEEIGRREKEKKESTRIENTNKKDDAEFPTRNQSTVEERSWALQMERSTDKEWIRKKTPPISGQKVNVNRFGVTIPADNKSRAPCKLMDVEFPDSRRNQKSQNATHKQTSFCNFCRGNHHLNDCRIHSSWAERKVMAERRGLCLRCCLHSNNVPCLRELETCDCGLRHPRALCHIRHPE